MKQWGIIPWSILFSMFAFGIEGALWLWGGLLVFGIIGRIYYTMKQNKERKEFERELEEIDRKIAELERGC